MTSKEKTKSLVNKASTDDRNPPSGYLLKELSSRTMSIQECQTIEDLVIKKLAKNKPYIKYKALRIVKYLCENGSPNWRRAWQRNTDKLRDAQQFRGPPDPIYGDAPYQQVRKAAKDAMQAVFQQSQINSSNIASRIKGVDGGSAYGGYSGGSSFGGGSKGVYGGASLSKSKKAPSAPSWDKKDMPGHGNTTYQPTVRTTTFEPLKSSGGYSNPAVLAGTNVHSRGKLDTRKASKGKRKKGKVAGIWGGDEDDNDAVESEEEDYQTYDDFPASTTYEKPRKKAFGGNIKKKSKSSGQYEKRWVDDIVKSGGVGCKILDLPKYVQQFENLSKNHVLEYLDEKLEDSAWQKQGKALALIEALIKGKSSDDVIDYFNQSPENIQACQNAKKSILRRKANAIVEYLDIEEDDEEEEEEEEVQQQQQQHKQEPVQASTNDDLLGMGGGNNDEEEEEDMFADMNTEEKPKQPPQQDLLGNSMFDNMNQAQQTQVATNDNDLMGLMGDVVSTQENLQQAQEEQRKKEKYAFLDNLAADAGVTQQNNGGDMLGFGSNTNAAKTQPPQQSGGGSAFGFDLGGSGDKQSQSQSQPVIAPTTQTQQASTGGGGSAFGFDLGGSGNGGNISGQTQIQQQVPQQSGATTGASTGGGSAFGFDLSGSGASTQQQSTQATQSMNSMNTMGMMGNQQAINNPMMTQNMLQQNMQNMAQMNQMMNQMQQMQMNPNMMNMMQQKMMQQNMMQQNMMQSGGTMMSGMSGNPQTMSGGNSFLQAMQNVNNPGQPQKPQQAYVNRSDPFAQMMATASNTSSGSNAPQRAPPKKTGPDPFAEFGLNAMQ